MLWFCGLAGAFVYAGPRLLTEFKKNTAQRRPAWINLLEFGVALIVGAIAAEVWTGLVMLPLKVGSMEALRGVSALIGLLANNPKVIEALSRKGVSMIEKAGK